MAAQSVTGTGTGASNKFTTKELSALANGPSILISSCQYVYEAGITDPPSILNTVTLNPPLPGNSDNYIVVVSGVNTGPAYVAAMLDNEDGDFHQFIIMLQTEGICMYSIIKAGNRPTV